MRLRRRVVMLSVVAGVVGVAAGVAKQELLPQKPPGWDAAWETYQRGKSLPQGPLRAEALEEATKSFLAVADTADATWAPEALMMAGLCREWLGDDAGAVAYYERALRDYPNQGGTAVHVYLAQAYQRLNRPEDAQAQAQALLTKAKAGHVPAWQAQSAQSILGGGSGKGSPAWELFDKGKDLPSGTPEQIATFEQAQKLYEAQARDSRGDPAASALMMAGLCRDWLRDYAGAAGFYERALGEKPQTNEAAIRIYLASAYVALSREAEARAQAQLILALPNADALPTWIAEQAKSIVAGEETPAMSRARGATWDAFARGKRALNADERAKWMKEAEAGYVQQAEREHGSTRARSYMMAGVCRDWVSDDAGAAKYLERALDVSVGDERLPILSYLTQSYVALGRFEDARAAGRRLQELGRAKPLADWQTNCAALAVSDDETLTTAKALMAEMRVAMNDTKLSREERTRRTGELRRRLDSLAGRQEAPSNSSGDGV